MPEPARLRLLPHLVPHDLESVRLADQASSQRQRGESDALGANLVQESVLFLSIVSFFVLAFALAFTAAAFESERGHVSGRMLGEVDHLVLNENRSRP